jgi:hypothetical protein
MFDRAFLSSAFLEDAVLDALAKGRRPTARRKRK